MYSRDLGVNVETDRNAGVELHGADVAADGVVGEGATPSASER